jgi:hypothetical protein
MPEQGFIALTTKKIAPTPKQMEEFDRKLRELVEATGLHAFVCSFFPRCRVTKQGKIDMETPITNCMYGCAVCCIVGVTDLKGRIMDSAGDAMNDPGTRGNLEALAGELATYAPCDPTKVN